MVIRLSKALLVLATAIFATLVSLNNIVDYNTNFEFVRHVLMMDTTFPGNGLLHRAVNSTAVHHTGYVLIISLEIIVALLCWLGGLAMLRWRNESTKIFQQSKHFAIIGLTIGFLLWQVGFMTIGGEWFGMWMSHAWNGIESAFRFFSMILLVLMYVSLPNDDLK